MSDKKSIIDQIEEKAKEIGKKVEDVLDDISADEERLTVTYPDDNTKKKPDDKGPK